MLSVSMQEINNTFPYTAICNLFWLSFNVISLFPYQLHSFSSLDSSPSPTRSAHEAGNIHLNACISTEISWQNLLMLCLIQYVLTFDHRLHDNADFYKSSRRLCGLPNILPRPSRLQRVPSQKIESCIQPKSFIQAWSFQKAFLVPLCIPVFSPRLQLNKILSKCGLPTMVVPQITFSGKSTSIF